MEPRSYRFYTKRSEHYNNLEKQEAELNKSIINKASGDYKLESGKPLKDNTNIQKLTESDSALGTIQDNSNKVLIPQHNLQFNLKEKRPLKCLETLAEKAGISLDDKPDNVTLDSSKPQSPAQGNAQQQQQQVNFQISHEQLQQMQQMQLFNAIQVKQEYPNQQTNATHLTEQQMQVLEGQQQGQHQVPTSIALNQTGTTLSNTLAMSGQGLAEWQNRVQVVPQTMNAQYLQQFYPGQQPIVMHGISGIGGQQQIQLIQPIQAAPGKPFQGSPLAGQQMITHSQGKQVISGSGALSGSYTLPTIPSSQSQTIVISNPFNMISSQNQQGQNVMPSINTTQNANKSMNASEQMQKQLVASQKLIKGGQQGNVNQNTAQGQQCVQVPSAMPTTQLLSPLQQTGQTVQYAPWIQSMPIWTANSLQSPIYPPNSILISRTNPDGTQGMFIQQTQNPQQAVQQTQAQNQTVTQLQCGIAQQKPVRAVNDNGTPKQIARAPTLLPQGSTPPIRPASSVSTQTAQGPNAGILTPKTGKVRTNKHTIRPPGPLIKQDLGQAKVSNSSPLQQVITSTGNKMVVMSTGIGQIQQATDKQFLHYQQQMAKNQQAQIQQKQELQQQYALQMQNQSPSQQQQQQANQNNLAQFAVQMQNQSPSQQQVNQNNMGQFQLTASSQAQSVVQNTFLQGQPQGLVLQGQQMVLHNQNGQPTLTMAPSNLLAQQTPNTAMPQQLNIQPKPINQTSMNAPQFEKITMPIVSSAPNVISSIAQNISSTQNNNNLIGQVSSPQSQIQPPQNPLLAMTNLSTSPLSVGPATQQSLQKDIYEQRNSVSSGLISQNMSNSTVQSTIGRESSHLIQSSSNMSPMKVNIPKTSADGKTESLSAIIGSSEPADTDKSDNRLSVVPTTPISLQSSTPLAKTSSPSTTSMSSPLNGISSAGVNISSKNEKGLPKAMVKPNVLTHVIEGFVIQESQEPFPVNRQRYSDRDENDDEPPKKKALTVAEPESSANQEKVACAHCGKLELKTKLKKKKYCSFNCSKQIKGEGDSASGMEDIKNSTAISSGEPMENGSSTEDSTTKTEINTPIGKWTAKEVCKFIADVLGTDEYSEDFTTQEIDGSALILLKEKHLVNAMGMKLGPALKIVAKVQSLLSLDTEASAQQNPSTTTANQ